MRFGTLISAVGFIGALTSAATPSQSWAETAPACSLKLEASLPATVKNGRLLIPADLDGRRASLAVDTGGPIGIITRSLVEELKLQEAPLPEHSFVLGSGKDFTKFVMVHRLQVANLAANNVRFLVGLGADRPQSDVDGTFGANFLTRYDVELDLAHGKFNLFSQDHCRGQVVYWSDTAASAPIHLDEGYHTILPVLVNGKQVQALLDTGSPETTIGEQVAQRMFGINSGDDASNSHSPSQERPRHRFESLQIGGVEFRNTEIALRPEHNITFNETGSHIQSHAGNDPVDLVIGLRHLEKLRIYLAYGEGMIYVTPADAK